MTPKTPRAALRIATTALAAVLLAPAAAQASTWTVDDDKAQCPTARFSSIQEAVDYAAPYDTIIVCDGLYQERSTPTSGNHIPTQAGARNGLTISKQLTIKGTGASKVIIEPDPSLGTLAGTAPYLRDGGGNVVTVTRASLGNGDDNELIVDISGVTVRSGGVYAEAGIAYFQANGTIEDAVVGPLKRPGAAFDPAAPHGWGIIQTNFLQGGGPGSGTVRRTLTIEDSVVKGYVAGGILFDGGRGIDGSPESLVSAGITQLGYVKNTKVEGGGLYANVPQTGIRYAAGARGSVTGSEITENLWSSAVVGAEAESYGIFLADSLNGADPDQNGARGVTISSNYIARNRWGLWNGTTASTFPVAVRAGAPAFAPSNWWGCVGGPRIGLPTSYTVSSSTNQPTFGCSGISGNDAGDGAATPPIDPAPSVEFPPISTTLPEALPAPSTADAAPTATFAEVTDLADVPVGTPISPVITATDDFGVTSVELAIDGTPFATLIGSPYEFSWTPLPAHAGKTVTLTATAFDSAGQTTSVSAQVKVAALPVDPPVPPAPPLALALPVVVGDPQVGETIACSPGIWTPAPTALSFQWARGGTPIAGATAQTYVVSKADLVGPLSCVVTVGGVSAASPARTASLKPVSTRSSSTFAVGPAIITLSDPAVGSRKTGTTRIGGVECVASCRIVVSGKIEGGRRSAWIKRITVTTSGKAGLRIKVPASLRGALRSGTGTAQLRIAVTAAGTTTVEETETAIRLR